MKDYIKQASKHSWFHLARSASLGELKSIKQIQNDPDIPSKNYYVFHYYNYKYDPEDRHTYILANNSGVLDISNNQSSLQIYNDPFHLISQNNPNHKKISLGFIKALAWECGNDYAEFITNYNSSIKQQKINELLLLNKNNDKIWRRITNTTPNSESYIDILNSFYNNKNQQDKLSSYIKYLEETINIAQKYITNEK